MGVAPADTNVVAVYSDSAQARQRMEKYEHWEATTLTQIVSSKRYRGGDGVRIYADGVFDLFHCGHAEQLRQIKQLVPNSYLIVGVCSDADTLKYKGGATVMNEDERCSTVFHCRYVDEVYRNPPFYPSIDFANSIKCDLVAHDALPYQLENMDDCYAPFKKADRFLTTQRTPMVSTTDIVQRILDKVEVYRQRQLVRLLGSKGETAIDN